MILCLSSHHADGVSVVGGCAGVPSRQLLPYLGMSLMVSMSGEAEK